MANFDNTKWTDYDYIKYGDTIIDMRNLLKEQDKAKAALLHLAPYLGNFIGKLRFIYTFRVQTQATDGFNILVNPAFTDELDLTQKCFVMAHEIMHCLLNHLKRGKGHDPELSNIAADYEVNITLAKVEGGIGLFEYSTIENLGALIDKKYAGQGYEAIYEEVLKKRPPKPKDNMSNSNDPNAADNDQQQQGQGQQGQGQQGQSGQSGPQGQQGQGSDSGQDQQGQQGQGQSGQDQQGQQGQSGQGQQGQSGQGQQGQGQGSGAGQDGSAPVGSKENPKVVTQADCMSPSELAQTPGTAGGMVSGETGSKIAEMEGFDPNGQSDSQVQAQWEEYGKNAIKQIGNGAGSALKNKLTGLYRVNYNWKKELAKIIGRCLNPAETRRAFTHKNTLISQGRVARTDKDAYNQLDMINIIFDTSGSMGVDELKLVLSHILLIANKKKPSMISLIQCDSKVQDVQFFATDRDLKKLERVSIKGGGGTDFADAFRLLREDKRFNTKRNELTMVFTDGHVNLQKRDKRNMNWLYWAIIDNPGFELGTYKDAFTKVVYFSVNDIK